MASSVVPRSLSVLVMVLTEQLVLFPVVRDELREQLLAFHLEQVELERKVLLRLIFRGDYCIGGSHGIQER